VDGWPCLVLPELFVEWGTHHKKSSWIGPWICNGLYAVIRHLSLPCWQLGSQWRCQTATRGVKGCEKILRSDLDWMEWWRAYICTRWSRPSSKRENRCLGRWMMLVQRQNLSSIVWMKKKNCHIGVSITTNWLLHLDLTAQLMVIVHSTFSRIWRYYCGDCHAATKFIEKYSWECNYSMRIPIDTIISSMVFVQVGLVVTPAIPVLHR
jgi:hypothetical protein